MRTARARKLKFSKIALVVCITALIWVWADLALDETPPPRPADIVMGESVSERLWISFGQVPKLEVRVTLSGPHSAFVALERRLRAQGLKKLRFVFDPSAENITEPPGRTIRTVDLLQKNKQLRDLGLKVEACEPDVLNVDVVALVEKTLPVECFDESGIALKTENDPSVTMFVPEDTRTAQVRLTRKEIAQARQGEIEKRPYVILAENQIRRAPEPVKIQLAPEQEHLAVYSISPGTLDIALSPALQGQYDVEITNLPQVLARIGIRASAEAKRAYEMQPMPLMTLHISDEDAKKDQEEQSKAVVYNFPREFVRKGEIELENPDQPAVVKFKLIRLPRPETPPAGTP